MAAVRVTDGSLDFTGGVDSSRPATVQGQAAPHGLARSKLAWLTNGTVRGGGITVRNGWTYLCTVSKTGPLYNGGLLYQQLTGNPYLMLSVGGRILQVRVDTNNAVVDITGSSPNPSTPQAYLTQAEQFAVIQAGDWTPNNVGTLPLIWDGTTMRRSVGIISANNTPNGGVKPYNEIPAALAMTYYQGRLWYANGRKYCAGDIVDGPSGSTQYAESDSVLKVTENPLALGGDGFTVPTAAGQITALNYNAQLDSTLGQGNLLVFTRRQVNALVVPVSRANWIAANSTNGPQQLVVLNSFGAASERSVVRVNSDLFFVSPEPAVRSLVVATRYFNQWGNIPVSSNIRRATKYTNPILLGQAPGITFNNRLLMGLLPVQTAAGTAYQGLGVLDFDLISTLDEQLPPAWDGLWEGLNVLQLFEGDFGGQQRAFAVVSSRTDASIQVWELTSTGQRDNVDSRITARFETPAYTWGKEFDLKKLSGGELWIDTISGTVDLSVEYRGDGETCWQPWFSTQFCAARTSCEDVVNPVCYPIQPYCEGNRFPLTLPDPQAASSDTQNKRPTNVGYQFQARVTISGWCRVRGILLHAQPVERAPFAGLESSATPSQPVLTPSFYNTPQSCTVNCPDGSPFTFTTAAGMFTGTSQLAANTAAHTYACAQAQARMLCLGSLNPASATIGVAYTGMIVATGGQLAVAPDNNFWSLNAGSNLPAGLVFNGGLTPSAEVSITGTPTTVGDYNIGVTVMDPQGNTMSKEYTVVVECVTAIILTQNTGNFFNLQTGQPPPYTTWYQCTHVPLNTPITFAANFQTSTIKTWNYIFFGGGAAPNASVTINVGGVPIVVATDAQGIWFYQASFQTNGCVPVNVNFTLTFLSNPAPSGNLCNFQIQVPT